MNRRDFLGLMAALGASTALRDQHLPCGLENVFGCDRTIALRLSIDQLRIVEVGSVVSEELTYLRNSR